MELPQQLKANRERLGLSQEDVAHAIFVSRQTMSSWENGKTYPDVQSLLLLSNLFGISIDELVKGDVVEMQETVSKDALKIERLMAASAILLLMGIGCMVGLYVVWSEPSIIPDMSMGSLAGLGAFIVLWIPSLICAVRIERIKKNRNLVTYRQIRAFMDGDEIPEDNDALSKRSPFLSSALKIACGVGVGYITASILTAIVNALK